MQNGKLFLYKMIPSFNDLTTMSPEELGHIILKYLKKHDLVKRFTKETIQFYDYLGHFKNGGYPELLGPNFHPNEKIIKEKLQEAWFWLYNQQRYIKSIDGIGGLEGALCFTDKGMNIDIEDCESYNKTTLLPPELLHSELKEAKQLFLQGKYKAAVSTATLKLETYLRQAINGVKSDYGTRLMSKAFRSSKENTVGILTDGALEPEEQEGICNLFRGITGFYRNISHHSETKFNSEAAARIIIMVSEMLCYIDSRPKTA